ncbi:MAG: tRNA dihydrouridine synthase DusB [Candidatus Omnitrophota bacterium]|nr:tRNA dihydrouridine synthase DusB [Candidatus Omnitrophota bacterium]
MLSIGDVKVNTKLILAPLSGVSDLAFRMISREFGAKFAFTEMLNACSIKYKSKKTQSMLLSNSKDKPLGAQILGRDIPIILNALDVIQKSGVDLIDFNAACPVRKVVRRGEGAALLKEPKTLKKIVRELVKHTTLPITVKIRSGWSHNEINAPDMAKLLEDAGASAIFIHARPQTQLYSGRADYELIRKVKSSLNIPLIGSGDIFTPADVKRMLDETGCDAALAARGAIGNPWIFKQTDYFLKTGRLLKPPTIKQKIKVMLQHLDMMIELYGEKRATARFRLFIPSYLKGISGARKVKARMAQMKIRRQLKDALATLNQPSYS